MAFACVMLLPFLTAQLLTHMLPVMLVVASFARPLTLFACVLKGSLLLLPDSCSFFHATQVLA